MAHAGDHDTSHGPVCAECGFNTAVPEPEIVEGGDEAEADQAEAAGDELPPIEALSTEENFGAADVPTLEADGEVHFE